MALHLSAARAAMVDQQLARRGIHDQRVLDAMRRIPREAFVPDRLAAEAYADSALPIDCEQTISQPVIVALMTQALQLNGRQKVLEIGTGSGYQTAILADLAAFIYTVERHAALSHEAQERLFRLSDNDDIYFRVGDGALGWPEEAPFDRIILTAAAETCPPALWEQLEEGGILVGPFGPANQQALYQIHKVGGKPQSKLLTGCRFVPLLPGVADQRN